MTTARSVRLPLALVLSFLGLPFSGSAAQQPPAPAPEISEQVAPAAPELPKDPIALYREGLAARAKKDAARYLAAFSALRERWPDDPDYLYRQAGALSLAGRAAEAVPLLRRVVGMEVYYDLEGEADLAALRALPEYADLRAAMEALKGRRVANAKVGFRLADRGIFPEGVAWDPKSGDFFVSAQPMRKIVRVPAKGEPRDFIASAQDGIGMVFGLRVDAPRRLLWAVSTAEPVMKGYGEDLAGQTGLFAFDLKSGKLRQRIWLPKGPEPQSLDDLTVAADGRVYASESGRGAIYTVPPGSGRLEAVIPPGGISYPNGIDVTPDGRRLYVADYSTGVFAVDPKTGEAVPLQRTPDRAFNGIDGLAYSEGALYAVQNGIRPPRILRLDLSPDGLAIAKTTVLEMSTPEMEEPTLGVLTRDRFCFVANSHDGKLRARGGPPKAESLSAPLVLCVPR